MEMHQIRYFLALVDALNFTKAAENCNVSQPSLTRAVKLLEEEFGGPLFYRERPNTRLSELGKMVKPHLQQIFDESHQAKRVARDFACLKKSTLTLGIMSTISPDEIVDLIANLRARHPHVELKLCDANARDLRTRLLAGDLEVVIYALPGEQPDDRTHSIPLFREQMVLAVHRGHRLAKAVAFPVQEMNGESYIHRVNCEFAGYTDEILRQRGVTCTPIYWSERDDWTLAMVAQEMNGESYIHRVNCEFAGYADEVLQQRGVTCTPIYWSERDDWTLAMVAAGLGFAFMPANAVKHPGVVGLPIVQPEFWRQVNLVSVRGRRYSPGVGSLVQEAMRKTWFGERPRPIHIAA